MSEQQFKAGDVVQLKSGGPHMTVSSILPGGSADCTWFDEKNEPRHETFLCETLKMYERPSRSMRRF